MPTFGPIERDPEICHFPKHKGERWEDVVIEARPYVEWIVGIDGPDTLDEEAYDHVIDMLEEN